MNSHSFLCPYSLHTTINKSFLKCSCWNLQLYKTLPKIFSRHWEKMTGKHSNAFIYLVPFCMVLWQLEWYLDDILSLSLHRFFVNYIFSHICFISHIVYEMFTLMSMFTLSEALFLGNWFTIQTTGWHFYFTFWENLKKYEVYQSMV